MIHNINVLLLIFFYFANFLNCFNYYIKLSLYNYTKRQILPTIFIFKYTTRNNLPCINDK